MEPGQHDSRSSVEISRNAKGDTQWVVKTYRDPGQEDEAKEVTQRIHDELTRLYYLKSEI